jgi:hypothetical protein
MPQPTLADIHVNRPLTNLTVGYVQDASDFAAGQLFPSVPVTSRSDLYYVYNRGDFFRNNMQKRAPGTPAAAGGYKLTTAPYTADVWALKKIIDDQIRANYESPLDAERDATQWLTQQALINRDVNFVAAYFGTGIWGTDLTGHPTTADATHFIQWSNTASTPIDDILNAQLYMKRTTGMWPNVLALGAQVYIKLLTHPQIIDRLKYGQTGPGPVVVSTSDLQALFKVDKVVVMSAIQTTSPENMDPTGAGDTFDFIAGKHALLAYASPNPGLMQPSAGYTFNWTGLTGATAAGIRIKKFRWEVDAADHLEIEQAYAFGKVAAELGYFFSGAVA